MSSETSTTRKRTYRKRRRAQAEEATRQRIAVAAAELHEQVGPAQTTFSAVAERAGVQRGTVYRHFPDEAALFEACSAHWNARNAPPDPTPWSSIGDPDRRLRKALTELYAWYEQVEPMLEKLYRDVSLVPAVAHQLEASAVPYLGFVTDVLLAGRPRRKKVRAAIGHALAFETWRSLVRGQGLSSEDAVSLMVALVADA
jgi:AcrR family transcriptional regulator